MSIISCRVRVPVSSLSDDIVALNWIRGSTSELIVTTWLSWITIALVACDSLSSIVSSGSSPSALIVSSTSARVSPATNWRVEVLSEKSLPSAEPPVTSTSTVTLSVDGLLSATDTRWVPTASSVSELGNWNPTPGGVPPSPSAGALNPHPALPNETAAIRPTVQKSFPTWGWSPEPRRDANADISPAMTTQLVRTFGVAAVLAITACGGGGSKPTQPVEPVAEPVADKEPAPPAEPVKSEPAPPEEPKKGPKPEIHAYTASEQGFLVSSYAVVDNGEALLVDAQMIKPEAEK